MNHSSETSANKSIARVAGFWYLLLAIGSGFSWMYMTKTFVADNAVQTAKNIMATESQYMIAILATMIAQISFVFLVLALNRLLRRFDESQARLMLSLVLISIPIMFINIIFQVGAREVLSIANYSGSFIPDQMAELSATVLRLHVIGVHIAEVFWGLWLFPLGCLVYKSNLFPRAMAFLLYLSGGAYLASSLTFLMIPGVYRLINGYLSLPESLGELAMLLWLLIKGVATPAENAGSTAVGG